MTLDSSKVVVLRLMAGDLEGSWWRIPSHQTVAMPPLLFEDVDEQRPVAVDEQTLVATGSVEWDGNRCAEVYVPESRLGIWRAEHDVAS